jgi:hypothetical protein
MRRVDGGTQRRRLLRLHAGLALATVLCTSAFVVELLRALGGNALSWAYVFEWPLLLAYGLYLWRRLVREERGEVPVRAPTPRDAEEDAAREAYNRYLAALHEGDPRSGAGTG